MIIRVDCEGGSMRFIDLPLNMGRDVRKSPTLLTPAADQADDLLIRPITARRVMETSRLFNINYHLQDERGSRLDFIACRKWPGRRASRPAITAIRQSVGS